MANDTSADPRDIRVGATIRALREAHELSSDELGRAVGVTGGLIRHIERGERHATMTVCRAIARTLNIPLAAITVEGYDKIADAS